MIGKGLFRVVLTTLWSASAWIETQTFVTHRISHAAFFSVSPQRHRLSLHVAGKGLRAEDGVNLDALTDTAADSIFLSNALREHLDNEWIPQSCHRDIGEKVLFLSACTTL